MIAIGHCPIAIKRNIIKQLSVCMAVYKLLTASLELELALPGEKVPNHMC